MPTIDTYTKYQLQLHGPYDHEEAIKTEALTDGAVACNKESGDILFKCDGQWFFIEKDAPNAAEQTLHIFLAKLTDKSVKDIKMVSNVVITYNKVITAAGMASCNVLEWVEGDITITMGKPTVDPKEYEKIEGFGTF